MPSEERWGFNPLGNHCYQKVPLPDEAECERLMAVIERLEQIVNRLERATSPQGA